MEHYYFLFSQIYNIKVKNIISLKRDLRCERFHFTGLQDVYNIRHIYVFLFYHFEAGIFRSLSSTIIGDFII